MFAFTLYECGAKQHPASLSQKPNTHGGGQNYRYGLEKKSNPRCWRAGLSINESGLGPGQNRARRER
jgi:hypothetical protein